MYVIYVESGEYSDYSKSNLFVTDSEEYAKDVCDQLGKAHELYSFFKKEALSKFDIEWKISNPEPKYSQPDCPLKYPIMPQNLAYLTKEQRENVNIIYKENLDEYHKVKQGFDEACNKLRIEWNNLHSKWGANYKVVKNEFIQNNFASELDAFLQENIALIASTYYLSFNYEEVKMIEK
jgi:hypothetical protein